MLRPALFFAVAVALLAALPGSAEAREDVLVKALRVSPATAQIGDNLTVRGKVRLARRRPRKVVVVAKLLGSGPPRRLGRRVFKKVRPSRPRRFVFVTPLVARGLGAGSYDIEVCPRSRGRRARCARRRLTIAPGYTSPTPTATATPTASPGPAGAPGAETLGDRLFPNLGNGGYDAQGYDVALTYVPLTDQLSGTGTMAAIATQALSRLSLDFQGFNVSAVTVDGAPAGFSRLDGLGTLGPHKLRITPATPIASGAAFTVRVQYSGSPPTVTDPDGSIEGFLQTTDGAFVVGEPMGTMGWLPSNNHPSDKATLRLAMTVPQALQVIGNGVLESNTIAGLDRTFVWNETHPMSTYLATATLGTFNVTKSTAAGIDYYDAAETVPGSGVADQPAAMALFQDRFGSYPFSIFGSIVDNANPPFTPLTAYALETQTKPVYPSVAAAGTSTVTHELAHQWFGNSVSPAAWEHIWLNEGFAEWSSWLFEQEDGGTTTAAQFTNLFNANPEGDGFWTIPPAAPPTAADIFNFDAMYNRGAMTLEALRQIHGDAVFYDILRTWATDRRYGIATTAQFIAHVKASSDKSDARLDQFFQDWLYEADRPAITPSNF